MDSGVDGKVGGNGWAARLGGALSISGAGAMRAQPASRKAVIS